MQCNKSSDSAAAAEAQRQGQAGVSLSSEPLFSQPGHERRTNGVPFPNFSFLDLRGGFELGGNESVAQPPQFKKVCADLF